MSKINEELSKIDEELAVLMMLKYTTKRYYPDPDKDTGEYRLALQIDHQSFDMAVEPEDKEHADWFRRQLGIALARLVKSEQKV